MSEVLYNLQQSLSSNTDPKVPFPGTLKLSKIHKELLFRIENLTSWKSTVNHFESTPLEIKQITEEIDSLIACYSTYLKMRSFSQIQIEELEKLMKTYLHLSRPIDLDRKFRIKTFPNNLNKDTPKETLLESLPKEFKYLLSSHASIIYNGILTSNQNTVIYSNADSSIRFWDISLNMTTKVLVGHKGFVNGLALTSDQKILFSCSSDYLTLVWDLRSCEKIYKIRALKSPILKVVVSEKDEFLAVSNSAGEIRVYKLAEAIDRYAQTGAFFVWLLVNVETKDSVRSLGFTFDNQKIVASCKGNGIFVRDLESGVDTRLIVERGETVQETSDLKIYDSGVKMIAVGIKPNLTIWDLENMTEIFTFDADESELFSSVVVTKNNSLAYTTGVNNFIYEVCLTTFQMTKKLKITESSINCLLLRNENELITLGNHVTSFDIETGKKKFEVRQGRNIELVSINYKNGHFLDMNSKNEISIVNMNTFKFQVAPYKPRDPVKTVSGSLSFCAVSDGVKVFVYKNKESYKFS